MELKHRINATLIRFVFSLYLNKSIIKYFRNTIEYRKSPFAQTLNFSSFRIL